MLASEMMKQHLVIHKINFFSNLQTGIKLAPTGLVLHGKTNGNIGAIRIKKTIARFSYAGKTVLFALMVSGLQLIIITLMGMAVMRMLMVMLMVVAKAVERVKSLGTVEKFVLV